MDVNKKFKELILYIAKKSESDPAFGAVKLNKILFFSDFSFYWRTGESITGQEYMKLNMGPAPKRLLPIQNELIEAKDAVLADRDYYDYSQKRLIALREADLTDFTGAEIAEVDLIIDIMKDANGTLASEISHRFMGWKAARHKEVIPYPTAFLTNRELTDKEYQHGMCLERQLG